MTASLPSFISYMNTQHYNRTGWEILKYALKIYVLYFIESVEQVSRTVWVWWQWKYGIHWKWKNKNEMNVLQWAQVVMSEHIMHHTEISCICTRFFIVPGVWGQPCWRRIPTLELIWLHDGGGNVLGGGGGSGMEGLDRRGDGEGDWVSCSSTGASVFSLGV